MSASKDVVTAWVIGHPSIFGEGIVACLEMNKYHVRTFAGICTEHEMRMLRSAQPPSVCVVIVDKRKSLENDCLTWIGTLKTALPNIYIVSIANSGFEDQARLLTAGADAFLSGDFSPDELSVLLRILSLGRSEIVILTALPGANALTISMHQETHVLRSVDSTGSELSALTQLSIVSYNDQTGLSRREKEVLSGLVNGDSNKMLARRFLISEATVKAHISSVFKKLGVSSRTQAVKCCMDSCPAGMSLQDWLKFYNVD